MGLDRHHQALVDPASGLEVHRERLATHPRANQPKLYPQGHYGCWADSLRRVGLLREADWLREVDRLEEADEQVGRKADYRAAEQVQHPVQLVEVSSRLSGARAEDSSLERSEPLPAMVPRRVGSFASPSASYCSLADLYRRLWESQPLCYYWRRGLPQAMLHRQCRPDHSSRTA